MKYFFLLNLRIFSMKYILLENSNEIYFVIKN
uniref:Uncharacterized protein n=1 Tax=viral metagenome TaxID=1070528 RepID=A0A6C0AEX7_9ZZZZ